MGFAALWILFFHTWCEIFGGTGLAPLESFVKRIGFCGVDIFFFLSSFGLVFSIRSHSVLKFYYRRFRRLAIPFLAVALLRYVLEGWTFQQLLKNVTGVNFYFDNIYSYLWFVPAIATLYLLFPLYYKLFSASSNQTIFTLCVLIIWLLASIALRDKLRIDLYGFTNRIPIFCAGCLAGHLSLHKTYQFNRSIWILFVLMLILGLYLSYLTNYQNMPLLVPVPNCCVPNFLMAVSISFLIPKGLELLHSISGLKLVAGVLVQFFAFFGMISLEIYCVQEWLFVWIHSWLFGHFHVLIVNAVFFIYVSAAGEILWLIQKPIWKIMK